MSSYLIQRNETMIVDRDGNTVEHTESVHCHYSGQGLGSVPFTTLKAANAQALLWFNSCVSSQTRLSIPVIGSSEKMTYTYTDIFGTFVVRFAILKVS